MEQEKEVRRRRGASGWVQGEEEKLGRWAMLPLCMSANSQNTKRERRGTKNRRRKRGCLNSRLLKSQGMDHVKKQRWERSRGRKQKSTGDKDWEGVITRFLPPLPSLGPGSHIPDWLKAPLVIVRSCRNRFCVWEGGGRRGVISVSRMGEKPNFNHVN